jgi:hypothetical protein
MRNCRSGPDLPDLAGRCSWPPALRFIRPLDQRDGRLRTVDEQRTREDEQHQGGDDDGKEQAIHQSQAMAACFVPRRAWVASASRSLMARAIGHAGTRSPHPGGVALAGRLAVIARHEHQEGHPGRPHHGRRGTRPRARRSPPIRFWASALLLPRAPIVLPLAARGLHGRPLGCVHTRTSLRSGRCAAQSAASFMKSSDCQSGTGLFSGLSGLV